MFPVSIPFIAGQWSLPYGHRPMWAERPTGFNPLHCGAVVASSVPRRDAARGGPSFNPLHCGAVVASSGRRRPRLLVLAAGFNPLHCGAVVASRRQRCSAGDGDRHVSIPFIAGQWSLLDAGDPVRCGAALVSIPFIAGQWSLHIASRPRRLNGQVSIPFIAGQWSLLTPPYGGDRGSSGGFNPLHCGAVVASN